MVAYNRTVNGIFNLWEDSHKFKAGCPWMRLFFLKKMDPSTDRNLKEYFLFLVRHGVWYPETGISFLSDFSTLRVVVKNDISIPLRSFFTHICKKIMNHFFFNLTSIRSIEWSLWVFATVTSAFIFTSKSGDQICLGRSEHFRKYRMASNEHFENSVHR